MANKLLLFTMIVGSALATNADTRNPPSFLRFARLPGINVRAFDNTTLGWNKTNWEDLESYKKVKVCEDEDSTCDSEVRWGGMTELLQNAEEVHLRKLEKLSDALIFLIRPLSSGKLLLND